ncbi:hypothetical protein LCGC14_3009880 [marine sediment metagenome]|uniref:Uncharacterized protein n=1 Tax=marine sediment metagenome TaxID=412755 RepID=A0A0F8ZPQ1_9ZZZZ
MTKKELVYLYEAKIQFYATKKVVDELEAIKFDNPMEYNDKIHDLVKENYENFKNSPKYKNFKVDNKG